MSWSEFWECIKVSKEITKEGNIYYKSEDLCLDLKKYSKNFNQLLHQIKFLSDLGKRNDDSFLGFENIRSVCFLQVNNQYKMNFIDKFLSLHWEILYCQWKLDVKNTGNLFHFPEFTFPNIEGIDFNLGSKPYNYILLSIIPRLFHREVFTPSRIYFRSKDDIGSVQIFLLSELWDIIKGSRLKLSSNLILELCDPEINPWGWIWLWGNWEKEYYKENIKNHIFRKIVGKRYFVRSKHKYIQKSSLARKILEEVYGEDKEYIFPLPHHWLARIWRFIPSIYRKFAFRVSHSISICLVFAILSLSILGFGFYGIYYYFLVKEKQQLNQMEKELQNKINHFSRPNRGAGEK